MLTLLSKHTFASELSKVGQTFGLILILFVSRFTFTVLVFIVSTSIVCMPTYLEFIKCVNSKDFTRGKFVSCRLAFETCYSLMHMSLVSIHI